MRNICFDRNTFYFDFTLCRSCLVGNIPLFDRGKCLLCQTLVSVVTDTSPCHAEHKCLLSADNQLDFRRTVWLGHSSTSPVSLPKKRYSSGVNPVRFLKREKKCSVDL